MWGVFLGWIVDGMVERGKGCRLCVRGFLVGVRAERV